MTLSLFESQIFAPLYGDSRITAIYSDKSFVEVMVQVETALARAESGLGVIPARAAEEIEAALATFSVDFELLGESTRKTGVPVKELVRQIREHVGGEAAPYVHWGATTQDILDTAVILQARAALACLEDDLHALIGSLATMADQHRGVLIAGRTHSQQALPITFGYKVAGWLAPLLRHRERLLELKPRVLNVQFGGAVGTLAALGDAGLAVQTAVAQELDLGLPPLPWHTQRDNLGELAGWLSLVSASLAKIAQDVILLAQTEVAEVRESADRSRGTSSTMPQKSNPVASEPLIAAARSNAALLSSMHQAVIQEHERATHGWQMEWLTLPQMFANTALALKSALFLCHNLVVDEERMLQNVRSSNGLMLAEAVSFALAENMDKSAAVELVREACLVAAAENRHLVDVVRERVDLPLDWDFLGNEANYLGATDVFINRVLNEAAQIIQD